MKRNIRLNNFLLSYGFIAVLGVVFVFFSVATPRFLTLSNLLGLLHASIPLMILACGLVLVIMTGKLDISVGSIAFLSSAIGAVMMVRYQIPQLLGIPVVVLVGILCGMLNSFVVLVLKVNPLIASMGSMFILRGIALQITGARVISVPENLRTFGNYRVGPLYLDILIGIVFVVLFHIVHTRLAFGRHIMAVGNDEAVADRLGVRVRRVTFFSFTLSGLCAAIGGLFSVFQLGAVTLHMGVGLEFTAIAAIVIGGISLFGGEGSFIPGFMLGVLTLGIIENGLNHVGASPYVYPFVRGGIILIAMYADSLKQRVRPDFIAA